MIRIFELGVAIMSDAELCEPTLKLLLKYTGNRKFLHPICPFQKARPDGHSTFWKEQRPALRNFCPRAGKQAIAEVFWISLWIGIGYGQALTRLAAKLRGIIDLLIAYFFAQARFTIFYYYTKPDLW